MSSQTVFVTAGKTSFSHDVSFVQNAGNTSPGDPMLSVAYNSSGLTAYYRIPTTGAATAITLATQTVTGAYSSGGLVLISNTTNPGQYRFDPPNAVLATAGVSSVTFTGFAGLATHTVYYICLAVDFFTNTYIAADVTRWNGQALTGKTGAIPEFGIVDSGTAQSATGTTLVLRSAAAFANSELIGATVVIISATTGAGQSRVITAYVGSTDTATVDTWTTTPTGTIVYAVFAGSPASTSLLPSVNTTQFAGQTITAAAGVTLPSSVASPTNITAGTITTATNVTTVNGLAANVITAAATSTDFTTEIQSGLATAAALSTVAGYIDTEVASIKTKTDFLPSIAPGSAGGLFIAGSNAATTVDISGSITSTGSVTGAVASVTAPVNITAAAVDSIWDEPKAGHVTPATYGVYLDSAVSGVSTGGLSLQDIIDGVLDEQIGAHVTSGSVAATISSTSTVAGQVKSKTDNLTFTKAGEVDSNMQSVNGATITGTAPPFNAS